MDANHEPLPANQRATLFPLCPAHLVGLGAFQLAVALALLDVALACIPLALFVVVCLVAPFFPRWRFYGPVIIRGDPAIGTVALTFDDGPTPSLTPRLLDLLARHGVKATFFVVGKQVEAHPDLVQRILSDGHTIGNHSWSHDPLLMLRSRARLLHEVEACQDALAAFHIRPILFRPPVGILNPRSWRVLLDLGMVAVGFSRRGRDFGNRRVRGLANRLLKGVRRGDILLLHDGMPSPASAEQRWLDEVERVLLGLGARELEIRPLSELIRRPVMEPLGEASQDSIGVFYDGLAWQFDEEQDRSSCSPARREEQALVRARIETLLQPEHRVLEIGAGTGRFTLELARRVREVVAVDLSGCMLSRLEQKAAEAGISNVSPRTGDILELKLDGRFDVICSFSALEYIRDPGGLLQRLDQYLKPGGTIFIITAHRSPIRLFAQIGNALRQGLWLRAWSVREMRKFLAGADLEPVELSTHALKSPLNGGILLLVLARKAR